MKVVYQKKDDGSKKSKVTKIYTLLIDNAKLVSLYIKKMLKKDLPPVELLSPKDMFVCKKISVLYSSRLTIFILSDISNKLVTEKSILQQQVVFCKDEKTKTKHGELS